MSDKERDQIIWNAILDFYVDKNKEWPLEQTRQENQEKAYWCREAGDNQKLFINKPEQRLMARLIKSFLNTSYKGGFKERAEQENWFDKKDIIGTAESIISTSPSDKNEARLINFVTDARSLMIELQRSMATGTTQLTNSELNQEQTSNLDALRDVVNSKYDAIVPPDKPQDWSYEEKIVAQIKDEPFITILKMKELIRGFGIALTCDFLKESHLCNIAKPDVHLRHVFSMIDRIPYSEDLILVKRISEFAKNVGKNSNPNDFCDSGPYYIDKIIWMLCSSHKLGHKNKCSIPSFKDELLAKLQEIG